MFFVVVFFAQLEDVVALPEVPTEPTPEVPEFTKAEPGITF